jgi:hypothetical protein
MDPPAWYWLYDRHSVRKVERPKGVLVFGGDERFQVRRLGVSFAVVRKPGLLSCRELVLREIGRTLSEHIKKTFTFRWTLLYNIAGRERMIFLASHPFGSRRFRFPRRRKRI